MLRKRSVAIELRLRAEAEARKEAQRRLKVILARFATGTLALITLTVVVALDAAAKSEPVIQDIFGAKQLEKLIQEKDFVAVFWYARNCRTCDDVLDDLENIDDDAQRFNVEFVKMNDKRLAKSFGITHFPTLTFFRDGQLHVYKGDLEKEDDVLDFLTNEESLVIPDKIEDVNVESLLRIVRDERFVAVLFYDENKRSADVLNELENIDDEADVFNIRFVRIHDLNLAEDYSLPSLPSLVYFRSGIPLVYDGVLSDEEEVLEWLIQQQTSVSEDDVVESVSKEELNIMVKNVDYLLVLFHDNKKKSIRALSALENIDDDTDKIGVSLVEVDEAKVAQAHGIHHFPSLVFFKHSIPSVFDGDLTDNEEVLQWLQHLVEGADIEEVTDDMLDNMIKNEDKLAVLFYEANDPSSSQILAALEEIDDELDQMETLFVKISAASVAQDFGIEQRPALVIFENGIPNLYEGQLTHQNDVLEWIMGEISGDHTVEVVTDAMLDKMLDQFDKVVAFFYQKTDSRSLAILDSLETIDDDMLKSEVKMVRIDDDAEAQEYGLLDRLPALVFFRSHVPSVFDGDLREEEQVLSWVTRQASEHIIELVTGAMLDQLLNQHPRLAVYFYDAQVQVEHRAILDLENIDDDLDREGVLLVRICDRSGQLADRFGIEVVPSLVLFKYKKPHVYKGDVQDENKVIRWFRSQLHRVV